MNIALVRPGQFLKLALVAGLLMSQAPTTRADDLKLANSIEQADQMSSKVVPTTFVEGGKSESCGCEGAGCTDCDSCANSGGGWLRKYFIGPAPCAEDCPKVGLYLWSGYDTWRGPSEGSFPANTGGSGGVNVAAPLTEWMRDAGIGVQGGMSYGLYNWTGSHSVGNQQVQQQFFFTYGVFRRADDGRRVSWGVVQDWMVNNNFGILGQSFTLTQWRGQVAYALSERHEVGLLGMVRDGGALKPVGGARYQAVNQINAFYHHKFTRYGADGWFSVGLPENYRLMPAGAGGGQGGGSLGGVIFGSNMTVPLNDRLSLYANWNYMAPSASNPGPLATRDEVYNFSIGTVFYPGRVARNRSVAGQKWMPYLPVANNGNFFVDTNTSF